MTLLKLPKIGHHSAEAKDVSNQEPIAYTNAKKVIQVLDAVEDWESIKDLVVEDAPFYCQAEAIAEVKTIKGVYEWCIFQT